MSANHGYDEMMSAISWQEQGTFDEMMSAISWQEIRCQLYHGMNKIMAITSYI